MKCYSKIAAKAQSVFTVRKKICLEKNTPGLIQNLLTRWSARLAAVESAMGLKGFHIAAKL